MRDGAKIAPAKRKQIPIDAVAAAGSAGMGDSTADDAADSASEASSTYIGFGSSSGASSNDVDGERRSRRPVHIP